MLTVQLGLLPCVSLLELGLGLWEFGVHLAISRPAHPMETGHVLGLAHEKTRPYGPLPAGPPTARPKGIIGDSVSTVSDFLSPSEWVLGTIEFVFGFNPLEEAIAWFTGNWAPYVKCGEMWANTESSQRT